MIVMQQMQYNASNRMCVFQQFSGGDTPGPLMVLRPTIGPTPIQNPGCAPGGFQTFLTSAWDSSQIWQITGHFKKPARCWAISFSYLKLRDRVTKEGFWNGILIAIKLLCHKLWTPHTFCSTRRYFCASTARSCSFFETSEILSIIFRTATTSNSSNQR